MKSTLALCLAVFALAACSKAPPPPPKAEAPRPGVFDDQLKSLEKAKAVQGTLDEQARQQAQRIQDAER